MDPGKQRYLQGEYAVDFGDDLFKAQQILPVIGKIADLDAIRSYADIGCGNAGVFLNICAGLAQRGVPLSRIVGYEVSPIDERVAQAHPDVAFKRMDFVDDSEEFDLVTVNDVLEHVTSPQEFLRRIGPRTRYVVAHVPLDDRLSVMLANQYNYRLGPVGHISFWNVCSVLNLITASGLLPLYCRFTPGFLAPSGRVRLVQKLAIPLRWLVWKLSPPLAAATVGGVSLALLCRANRT